jgi:hypothetical protein
VTRRHLSKPGRRGPGIALGTPLAVLLVALAPAAAEAKPPRISEPPVIAGAPQIGATLVAEGAEWDARPSGTATWQWLRCESPDQGSCHAITGATATS